MLKLENSIKYYIKKNIFSILYQIILFHPNGRTVLDTKKENNLPRHGHNGNSTSHRNPVEYTDTEIKLLTHCAGRRGRITNLTMLHARW